MSVKAKNFKSADGKLVLKLRWDDEEKWIEASVVINLSEGEGVKYKTTCDTYPYGHSQWNTIRNNYSLNTNDQYDTTIIKVYKTFSDIDYDHSEELPEEGPHEPVNVPHTICAELLAPDGGQVSLVTGEAL